MVVVNLDFHKRKNFFDNYPQFGQRSQNLASPVLGQKKLGAKLACPGRQIINLSGATTFLGPALTTIVVVVVVIVVAAAAAVEIIIIMKVVLSCHFAQQYQIAVPPEHANTVRSNSVGPTSLPPVRPTAYRHEPVWLKATHNSRDLTSRSPIVYLLTKQAATFCCNFILSGLIRLKTAWDSHIHTTCYKIIPV